MNDEFAVTDFSNGLRDRLQVIRYRIGSACGRVSRSPDSVKLIAVTKTQPVAVMQALIDCGVQDLGENRVQEILEKAPHLTGHYSLHCIGHLQTNKVARVMPFIAMVQSVDRIRLVEYLERYCSEKSSLPVLVEVNTSGETAKSGCSPDQSRMLLERCLEGGRVCPYGFMTIGPLTGGEIAVRKSFAALRSTAEKCADLVPVPQLSMGMSSDFEWAIEEGSTMVRIGTLLVGTRG